VSEHDDLDRQFVLFAPAKLEQLEYPNQVPRAAIVAPVGCDQRGCLSRAQGR